MADYRSFVQQAVFETGPRIVVDMAAEKVVRFDELKP
jgi:hypothetical protein